METTEKHEEKASEILARAAKLLNDASKVYEANFELMKEQDALQQDLLHKLEIENLTRDERAKLATELRDCRRLRRKYKDVVEELEPIAGYCGTAAGMQAVNKGQMEAARCIGMSKLQANFYIIIPQAIKNVLPSLCNEFILLIKNTSIVSVIALHELTYTSNSVRANTFLAFEPLIVTAFIYFVITYVLKKLVGILERRLRAHD